MRHHVSGIRRLLSIRRGKRSIELAVDEEVSFHLEMRIEALMRSGLSIDAAVQQARTEFGDVAEARRELTAMGRRRETRATVIDWWRDAVIDARVAIRSYRRSPQFTVVVLL